MAEVAGGFGEALESRYCGTLCWLKSPFGGIGGERPTCGRNQAPDRLAELSACRLQAAWIRRVTFLNRCFSPIRRTPKCQEGMSSTPSRSRLNDRIADRMGRRSRRLIGPRRLSRTTCACYDLGVPGRRDGSLCGCGRGLIICHPWPDEPSVVDARAASQLHLVSARRGTKDMQRYLKQRAWSSTASTSGWAYYLKDCSSQAARGIRQCLTIQTSARPKI